MAGDWGGVVYLTCPLSLVRCSEEAQRRLHAELEKLSGDEPEGRGMGIDEGESGAAYGHGGKLLENLWLDEWLADLLEVENDVTAILLKGEEDRAVFRPSIETIFTALSKEANRNSWERALLALIVLAGFHGHRSKVEDRKFWRADIWALRGGWEVGREADNLLIYANCASEASDIAAKLANLLECVNAERNHPMVRGKARFVLFTRGSEKELPTEAVKGSATGGITLCPEEATRELAAKVVEGDASADEFFRLLAPIPR